MTPETPGTGRNASAMSGLVYICDDEAEICAILASTLEIYGFRSVCFQQAGKMLAMMDQQLPDACLIDLGLPDMDGMSLINEIRKRTSLPVIVLSARSHSSDRVMGLELGADDYVVKPFDPREIVARLRSVLRRSSERQGASPGKGNAARFAGWTFHPGALRLVSPSGEETFLSTGEATLLEALLRAPKRVLSRDYLLEHGGRDDSLDRSIDVRISRIRKKLASESDAPLIRTIYGSGYMLTTQVDWA